MTQQDGKHPMQPLCPRRQPWLMLKVGTRPRAMDRSPTSSSHNSQLSVEKEILLRQRIEERAALKIERRHLIVDAQRHARRLQRQKSSGDAGKKVKALQEAELMRSSSLKSSH